MHLKLYSPGLCASHNIAFYLCNPPLRGDVDLCMAEMSLNVFVSIPHILILKIIFYDTVSQSPAIMHMLDKSGSCGKFENYQRPEGFPVGTCG